MWNVEPDDVRSFFGDAGETAAAFDGPKVTIDNLIDATSRAITDLKDNPRSCCIKHRTTAYTALATIVANSVLILERIDFDRKEELDVIRQAFTSTLRELCLVNELLDSFEPGGC